jgi:glycerophosphoryl diester phosphodiesterase
MTLLTRRAMTTAALAGTFLPGLARAQGKPHRHRPPRLQR